MNTLADTLWSVSCSGPGANTVKFYGDGTALITFPNGNMAKAFWAETADGHFVIQSPYSRTGKGMNQVYFGIHNGGEGNGLWNQAESRLKGFIMTNESN